ncbi:MAG: helix-turn-helix domain-containing protein [Fibromonadaceae bacterium]|jgi:cytoskeletal protein RodZ|nr:helix-turn-helix domain-containing protein [Fibromonadaceae bacterium]
MTEEENDLSLGADEQVGDYLRRIREARGLEIDQLAKIICLQKSVLQAIEENRWEEFPTEAYLRSYIAAMCGKLSIDKDIVLKKFSIDRNSQFAVAQISLAAEKRRNSKPSNISTIGIIIILLIIAALFFVSKYLDLDKGSQEPTPEAFQIDIEIDEENEIIDEEEQGILDTITKEDTAKVADIAVQPTRTQDTLRFECTPAAADRTCGVSLRGLDTKMFYFTREARRFLNHNDTLMVTVTVPPRTRTFLNGSRLEFGNFNTLLFYRGQIIEKRNRELR